jgi:rhamnopyranosyl-N-acetylglucosaminyl-diphospho-decaprenol beta-1,3/1,4-galactofuranosyltransferase
LHTAAVSSRTAALVLTRDRPGVTRRTIDAVLAQEPPFDAALLVDNAGTPELSAVLADATAADDRVSVLRLPSNLGCAGGYEAGLRRLLERDDLDYICGFDDDATPLPGCLAALLSAAASLPDAAEIGAVSHDEQGTLAWPMLIDGEPEPLRTLDQVRAAAGRHSRMTVPNLAWHGLLFPVPVLRAHGIVWGDLFLQYEDIELGLRYRRAGLRCYLVPEAECLHPAPPSARRISLLGRAIDVTAETPAKEYLSLRNGLRVWHRYDGVRFWYGSGVFVLLRGLLTCLRLDLPLHRALRDVFLRGVLDAARGRLGPPPPRLAPPR